MDFTDSANDMHQTCQTGMFASFIKDDYFIDQSWECFCYFCTCWRGEENNLVIGFCNTQFLNEKHCQCNIAYESCLYDDMTIGIMHDISSDYVAKSTAQDIL